MLSRWQSRCPDVITQVNSGCNMRTKVNLLAYTASSRLLLSFEDILVSRCYSQHSCHACEITFVITDTLIILLTYYYSALFSSTVA